MPALLSSTIRRVACGISGGVDSAVTALLLKKRGYEVVGVYMKNWDPRDEAGTCSTSHDDLEDAKFVCEKLKIELLQVSFVKEYWNDVFSSLLEDYENGMTPNPDIFCNRFIKFGAFYRYAMEDIQAQAIATGHYARTSFGPFLENYQEGTKANLLRAVDPIKDQTLFLSQVKQEALRKTMFPLGSLFKTQVRKIAHDNGMEQMAKKKDSTGICFIGNRKFKHFISEYIPNKRGPFVDIDTKETIGWHNGVHHYTIGQRCRLENQHLRYYIVTRDPFTQTIQVACGGEHVSMYGTLVSTLEPHWISHPPSLSSREPFFCMFRFQHADRSVPCQVFAQENGLRIKLSIPLRALTPGQIAVFYKGPICLGSAKIVSANWDINSDAYENVENEKEQAAGTA